MYGSELRPIEKAAKHSFAMWVCKEMSIWNCYTHFHPNLRRNGEIYVIFTVRTQNVLKIAQNVFHVRMSPLKFESCIRFVLNTIKGMFWVEYIRNQKLTYDFTKKANFKNLFPQERSPNVMSHHDTFNQKLSM